MKQSPATDTERDQSQKTRDDSDAIVWARGDRGLDGEPWGEGVHSTKGVETTRVGAVNSELRREGGVQMASLLL